MDGIIEVKVNGNSISKDNDCAGVQGESNSTVLRISFAENWDSYGKRIVFFDALGKNPVTIQLGTNLLEDILKDKRVYLVPIPSEAMTEAGYNSFVIQGEVDGIVKKTVEAKLKVLYSPYTGDANDPKDITPSEAAQLRTEMDAVLDDIAKAKIEADRSLACAIIAVDSSNFAKQQAEEAKEAKEAIEKMTIALNVQDGEGETSLEQRAWSEASANSATGKGAVALGGYNKAHAKTSMAVNYNNEVNAPNAFAANQSNKIPEGAEGAFVAGLANEARGVYQAIFGTYADVQKDDAFVIGNGDKTNKNNAFKVDKSGNAELGALKAEREVECKTLKAGDSVSTKSIVAQQKSYVGCGVITEKEGNFAQNVVEGAGAAAFGGSNKIYGRNGFALMTSNTIPENCESVFIAGHANKAAASHQAIFGTYADPASTDLFVIGNGTSAGRKNAFVVGRNGDATVQGKLYARDVSVLNFIDAAEVRAYSVKSTEMIIGETRVTEEQLQRILALADIPNGDEVSY